ncbi:MAG: hypothetical protein JWO33_398 [Caulobacteraceae bacterium]|nr:hypothetical protein [Caulobacteraceae bacterium]
MEYGKRARLAAALTAVFGVAALGLAVGFGFLPQVTSAKCVPADAVMRFELAKSGADVPFLYGACRAQAVAAMDAVNHLDLAAFIPSYCGFLALAAWFLARGRAGWLVWLGIAAAALTLAADVVETTTLLKITRQPDAAGALYPISSAAAWHKFLLIGVGSAVLAAIAWTTRPRRPILTVLLSLPAAGTVALFVDPHTTLLNLAYPIAWTSVLLVAAREALWPPRTAPPAS